MTILTHQQQESIKLVIEQMPGQVLLKSLDLTYLAGNIEVAKLMGFNDVEQLLGMTDYDMKNEAANYVDVFIAQDKKVIATDKQLSFLDILPYGDSKLGAFMYTKSIFKDSEGCKLGILVNTLQLPKDMLIKVCTYLSEHTTSGAPTSHKRSISPVNYVLSDHYEGLSLSKRQTECLFYLLRGLSAKSIAKKLGLSHRTVEGYIEVIKSKMGCYSKQQIIEKALSYGLVQVIPNSILASLLSDTLR